jgi:hypothetical protein
MRQSLRGRLGIVAGRLRTSALSARQHTGCCANRNAMLRGNPVLQTARSRRTKCFMTVRTQNLASKRYLFAVGLVSCLASHTTSLAADRLNTAFLIDPLRVRLNGPLERYREIVHDCRSALAASVRRSGNRIQSCKLNTLPSWSFGSAEDITLTFSDSVLARIGLTFPGDAEAAIINHLVQNVGPSATGTNRSSADGSSLELLYSRRDSVVEIRLERYVEPSTRLVLLSIRRRVGRSL